MRSHRSWVALRILFPRESTAKISDKVLKKPHSIIGLA